LLGGKGITNGALGDIQNLPRLQSLSLVDTGLTDAGLVPLAAAGAFPALRWLSLVRRSLTDKGMAHLRNRSS
jgi:hypothetical protein